MVKISSSTHVLGEPKILLDDQRCSKKKYINQIRVHGIMCSSRFFSIAQSLVCPQPYKLLVTNTSEAMGIGCNLSGDKIAQAES